MLNPPQRRGTLLAVLLLAFALVPGVTLAGGVSLRLSVDPRTVGVGQVADVTLELRGADLSSHPPLPAPAGLEITPTGMEASFSMGRGNVERITTFQWRLRAAVPGEHRLGPVEVYDGKQRIRSNDVELAVLAGPPRSSAARDPGSSPAPKVSDEPFFARASLSERDLVVGQSVIYRLEIGWAVPVGEVSPRFPDWGLLSPEGGLGQQQERRREVVAGRAFEIVTVLVPLFALEPGAGSLAAPEVNVEVRRSRGFFQVGQPVVVPCNAVAFAVRELPAEGRPAAFSGSVGQFTLRSVLEPKSLAAGETATRTVVIEGPGSLHSAKLQAPAPEGSRVYDEAPEIGSALSDGHVVARALFRQAVVPTRPGALSLPPARFSWFDPKARRYEEADTGAEVIEVTGEVPAAPVLGSAPRKAGVVTLGSDILPPHPAATLLGDRRVPATGPGVLALTIVPPATWLGAFLLRHRARSRDGLRGQQRRSRQEAKAAIQRARSLAKVGDWGAVEGELRRWISARLQVQGAALTPDELAALLVGRGQPASAELGRRLFTLVEAARYGAGAADGLADELVAWATELDRRLP